MLDSRDESLTGFVQQSLAQPQTVAIDENNAAQDTPVIDPRHAMSLRKERPKPGHLRVRQPKKIAHRHRRQFGRLNHAAKATASRSMGPDPSPLVANFSCQEGFGGARFLVRLLSQHHMRSL